MFIVDMVPMWGVFFGTFALVLIAAEIGYRIGIWLQKRNASTGKTPISGAMVGGLLGLMAFLLAFTIGIVINQYNGRREMVVTEANAVIMPNSDTPYSFGMLNPSASLAHGMRKTGQHY